MTDEHGEEQNPPKCTAALNVQTKADNDSKNEFKDDDEIPQRPENGFDPFLQKSDPEGVGDIVRTIVNSLFRVIDDNFDHTANQSSNTLGMIVKDSLILKVKQSDKKEVPFDGLKTSLACGLIIDDDLQISFLPQIESLAVDSESENLSTKRKKSVSLAEEVKVFKGIENEFFADDEAGFCTELIDNRSDKIMDREKSEDRLNDSTRRKILTPQRSGSSFIDYLNTSQCQEILMEITKEVVKEFENPTDHMISSSLPQLISNDDEALRDNYAQNSTISSASGENQSIVSLVEIKTPRGSSKLNQSLFLGAESTQLGSRVNEVIKLSMDDEVEADEVYGKEKTASENVNDDNEKIKEIRKLMNEFLSVVQKQSGYKIRDEDRVPLNLESIQLSEDTKQQSVIEIATVSIKESQQAFEDIKNADSYVRGNISEINQKAREFAGKSDNFTLGDEIDSTEEKSHSCESSKINGQLLTDVGPSGSETSQVGRNNGMKFQNNGQQEELKLSRMGNDMKSTFGRKIESSTNDPLSGETLTKVSLNTDNLSKQSSGTNCGTNRQSTTDLSLKQTSSTVSRNGSKSSRKSSRICTSDIMRPDPNNLTAETFPLFVEDKDVLKQTEFTVALKAEESQVNLVDEEYEDCEGNEKENSTEALAVIEVLIPSSNEKETLMESRKDIKWEERDKVNGEEAFPRKSRSIESEGTLQYSSESRTHETTTGNNSSVLFKPEPAVVAYLVTPSAVGYQMDNERHKSLNESKSDKSSVASIGDIENTNTVNKSSRIEVDLVGIELIKSTKSLQDDRNRVQDKRTKGHKLLDDPPGTENLVQQSCQVAHNDSERNENEEKFEDSEHCPKESIAKSIAQKVSSDEDKVDSKTAKKMKIKSVRKSEESAKKFANSLSRIFNSSSSRKNCGKESRAALASRSSVAEDDSYIQEQSSCQIKTQKSEVTDNNGEELVAVKSLDSMQNPFTTHKESIQEFRKSSEKVYATKSTIASYSLTAENPTDDCQPVEKSQKKSSRKSFAGIRKLFYGASTRNKKDHEANDGSVISAGISSVTSVERSADDAEKSSLLSMAKSYIRRRSETKTEGSGAAKRSEDSMTPSTEDQKRISKEQGLAKTQTMFAKGMRKLFKKRSSVVDSVDHNQSSDVGNLSQATRDCSDDSESWEPGNSGAKEKSDLEQLVYDAITVPSWKDLGRNESASTDPLLRIEKKSDGRSRSHNRCTISDDDRDDIETSSNLKAPERRAAEIRFMEQNVPENKTNNLAQKQRLSEIVSNIDFRPIPSFAGRRSTIVMMAAPMAPRDEANPQESSRSNQAPDEPSSSPTVFYYLLGPSLDEALIDVRVIFQNLIDKIIGRRR